MTHSRAWLAVVAAGTATYVAAVLAGTGWGCLAVPAAVLPVLLAALWQWERTEARRVAGPPRTAGTAAWFAEQHDARRRTALAGSMSRHPAGRALPSREAA